MRIICDQCDQPIYGTVKKVSGNFNLHPECLIHCAEELGTANVSPHLGQQSSTVALTRWKQNALVAASVSNFK